MFSKSKKSSVLVLTVLCSIFGINYVRAEYYWKDYTGKVPYDAFVAGADRNDKSIYVGQVYWKDKGIIVAQINQDEKEVSVPIYGVQKATIGIKILCTKFENAFTWLPKNKSDSLGTMLINQKPVIGGLENNYLLYVGRVFSQGEMKIGKILGNNMDDARMYFLDGNRESIVTNFEILVMKNESLLDVRAGVH